MVAEGASAVISLTVANVPRKPVEQVHKLLQEWLAQQQQPNAQANGAAAEPLVSGRLEVDVTRLLQGGVAIWQDTIAPAVSTAHQQAAARAIQVQAVPGPQYERATAELLGPPSKDPGLLLPGAAAAAKRRQMAEAACEDWDVGRASVKRQRVGMQKCFNCGGYEHGIGDCPVPFSLERVNAAKAEAAADRADRGTSGGLSASRSLRMRYYDEEPTSIEKKNKPYAHLQSGQISEQLAEALGMLSAAAPPPWLSRMVALGTPPVYAAAAGRSAVTAAAGAAAAAPTAAGSADMPELPEGQSGGGECTNGSSGQEEAEGSEADEGMDFIPFDHKAAAAAEEGQQAEETKHLPLPGYLDAVSRGVPPEDADDAAPSWTWELSRGLQLERLLAHNQVL